MNEDPCLRAKAKVAYNTIRYISQQIRGAETPEGLQRMFATKNPWQRNWDGWKPNAECKHIDEFSSVPHTKKCVGHTPNIFIQKEKTATNP